MAVKPSTDQRRVILAARLRRPAVGGGPAGATLGACMAQAGHHVIILEKETAFQDRVRGEILLPWGSVEAGAAGDAARTGEREPARRYFSPSQ